MTYDCCDKTSVEVSSILSDVFNLSLAQEIFHDQLKIAKVIPIFKSGNKSKVSNYRPISILSPFSKIREFFLLEAYFFCK